MEAMAKKDVEVLYCYEPYDELVLMNLAQFDKKNLKSIENEMVEDKSDTDTVTTCKYKSESMFCVKSVWNRHSLQGRANSIRPRIKYRTT